MVFSVKKGLISCVVISVSCALAMGKKKEVDSSQAKNADVVLPSKKKLSPHNAKDFSVKNGVIAQRKQSLKNDVNEEVRPSVPSVTHNVHASAHVCVHDVWSSVAHKALSSVVSIVSTQQINVPRGGMGGLMPRVPPGSIFEDLLREFTDQERAPRKVQSIGSGFVIEVNGNDIFAVTNAHVVSDSKKIKVSFTDQDEYEASVVALDERSDLALIKFSASKDKVMKINTLQWGDSSKVEVAHPVMAIGNPFGFGGSVTVGIVSYKGRYVPTGAQNDFEFIQHSAQINMGNSGGCLLNTKGEVIGVNTAIITPNSGNVGIGFAIPSNSAKRIIEQLKSKGYIKRGYLGVQIQAITDELRAGMGLKKEEGVVLVGSVQEDGPSYKKLEPGDVIVAFEGKVIKDIPQLPSLVCETEIGKTIKLSILRPQKNGHKPVYKKIEVSIKVMEYPQEKDSVKKLVKSKDKDQNTLEIEGLKVTNIDAELRKSLEKELKKSIHGILIVDVKYHPDSALILLQKGEIIESVNSVEVVNNINEFAKIIDKYRKNKVTSVNLQVRSPQNGSTRFVPFKIGSVKEDHTNQEKNKKK